MNFDTPTIKTEYHAELNAILDEVRSVFGDDAATLFVCFVTGFSTSAGVAKTAAERIHQLSAERNVALKYDYVKSRFYFERTDGTFEFLNPFGSKRSSLTNYIIRAALIAHRALKTMPPGDYFEWAINTVQVEYGKLG